MGLIGFAFGEPMISPPDPRRGNLPLLFRLLPLAGKEKRGVVAGQDSADAPLCLGAARHTLPEAPAAQDQAPLPQLESAEPAPPAGLMPLVIPYPFAVAMHDVPTSLKPPCAHEAAPADVISIRRRDETKKPFQTHDHALVNTDDVSQERASDLATDHNGRSIMAKAKRDLTTAPETHNDDPAPGRTEGEVATLPAATQVGSEQRETARAPDARPPILTPDPRGVMSASLGEGKGGPRIQLLRSHKFKQMQIRFDEQPDQKYLAMLTEAGWIDRTQSEGVWTKQVGQGQWQPIADAERLFKEVANSIRKDKGLEPVMQGLSAA
jgi:hypothetical protein